MAKQLKITLTKNEVLSSAAVRAYLEDTLSSEQRAEFEALLAKDPFAADALEGLRNEGNIADHFLTIDAMAGTVRNKTGVNGSSKSIQLHWSLYAYAAALVAVIAGIALVFSFYKSQPTDTQLAKTEELPEVQTEIVAKEPTVIADSVFSAEKADSTTTALLVEKKDTVVAVSKPATPVLAAQVKKEENPENRANSPVALSVQAETLPAKTAEEIAAEGMTAFNNSEYGKAEKLFNLTLEKAPNNANAMYFGAVSAYINGNTAKAEKQFNQLLKNGLYTEGSKWYKANILLKRGEKAEAMDILRSLSISSGTYKSRAIKKLEEIE